jgi:hypothetical protein
MKRNRSKLETMLPIDQAESLRRLVPAVPWYRRWRRWWTQRWYRS